MGVYINSAPVTGNRINPPVWEDLRFPLSALRVGAAAGALKTDDYDNDAGLLEVDFHVQLDTEGSRTEYGK